MKLLPTLWIAGLLALPSFAQRTDEARPRPAQQDEKPRPEVDSVERLERPQRARKGGQETDRPGRGERTDRPQRDGTRDRQTDRPQRDGTRQTDRPQRDGQRDQQTDRPQRDGQRDQQTDRPQPDGTRDVPPREVPKKEGDTDREVDVRSVEGLERPQRAGKGGQDTDRPRPVAGSDDARPVDGVRDATDRGMPKNVRALANRMAADLKRHEQRMAQFDRLEQIFEANGKQEQLARTRSLRQEELTSHARRMSVYRQELGPEAFARAESQLKGGKDKADKDKADKDKAGKDKAEDGRDGDDRDGRERDDDARGDGRDRDDRDREDDAGGKGRGKAKDKQKSRGERP